MTQWVKCWGVIRQKVWILWAVGLFWRRAAEAERHLSCSLLELRSLCPVMWTLLLQSDSSRSWRTEKEKKRFLIRCNNFLFIYIYWWVRVKLRLICTYDSVTLLCIFATCWWGPPDARTHGWPRHYRCWWRTPASPPGWEKAAPLSAAGWISHSNAQTLGSMTCLCSPRTVGGEENILFTPIFPKYTGVKNNPNPNLTT